MDSVFNSKLEVPQKTKSFIIKLSTHTQFRIDEGLFENNLINSIRVEGISDESNSQIEISQNSLKGNNGPYPEITIVDVGTVILRTDSFSGEFRLIVRNSGFVKIYKNAFQNTSFEGQFSNIKDLRFDVGAFNKAQAKLTIEDSKIDELNRFEASLREIKFDNCTIGIIDTGAFDVNNINSIVFYRCKIDVFRSKAITEKLLSHNFSITNADIRVMESEAISGSGITELVLKNNNIDEIQSNAIYVVAANATISYNRINKLGDNWLRIKDFTHIHIHQNEFRDFGSMLLEQPPTSPNIVFCKFENNSITNPKPGSLNIPNKYCIIREISFYQLCSCNTEWLDQITSRDLKSLSYCRVSNDLKDCFKRSVYNILAWLNEVCDYNANTLDCMKGQEQKNVNSNFIDPNDDGGFDLNWIYIIVGIIILVILVLIVFIATMKFYTKRRQQQQQQAATHLSESNSAVSNLTPNGTAQKHQHIFSNEDRRIINQTLNILREKYPPDVYDEVNKNTQILLRGNINEMQRVKSIGDIVQALDECQNTGDDFVAFTDILYKHLASSSGTAPPIEPTYSEPVIQDDVNSISSGGVGGVGGGITNRTGGNNRGVGPYASTTVVPGITDLQTNIDHIYAEPTSAQQPLLTNEYASPADRNDDNMVDLYSEPISNERDRKIIPPYAIIGPKAYSSNQSSINSSKHNQKTIQQKPSTFNIPTSQTINQKNLPDVLHPSTSSSITANNKNNFLNSTNINNSSSSSSFKPLTNVQKMAKNFSNDPNFHITRSPTSNRRIPKYTIPNKKQLSDNNIVEQHQPSPSTSTSLNPSSFTSIKQNNNTLDYDNYITGSGTGGLIGNFNVNLSPSGEAATSKIVSGDNQSNHSGGSDITVQMDDIIEYADA
ncbi:uncharacterized protein LOC129618741 [Condylostylus longicornis]|uniref:uncharacterized protein LOC129618741 n=1 Tax=Condylostylus longicornis TaxID=2530218 RepID=UPI00244DF6D8|nr:uncharacterized protein LOC129618741 [Condylostylus longicornis]